MPAEQFSCPIPSLVMPVAAGRVGTWQQGDWHNLGLVQQPFLFAADMCQGLLGQAPGEEALAGFQLRLGSLAVPQYLCLTWGPGLDSP